MFENVLLFFGLVTEKEYRILEKSLHNYREYIRKERTEELAEKKRKRNEAKKFNIEIYRDNKSEFRWRMKSANNKIIADSGEGYKTRRSIYNSLRKLMEFSPFMEIVEK